MSIELPPVIESSLCRFRRRRTAIAVLRGTAEALLLLLAGIMAIVLLEAVFKPGYAARTTFSALLLIGSFAFWLFRAGFPLLRRQDLAGVAWDFERAAGDHFQERIVSAVELAASPPSDQPGISAWMVKRTIQLAEEEIRAADPKRLVDQRPATTAWKRTAMAGLLLGAMCLVPGGASRVWLALNPGGPAGVLSKIQLVVRPGNCRVRQGTPLEITANGPDLPDEVRTRITWNDGFQEVVAMQRSSTNEFKIQLPTIAQGFRYLVQAGDAESQVFSVGVEMPPRLTRMQLFLEFPTYTRWTNRVVEGGSADFLAGSKVRISLEAADEKVAAAEWISDLSEVRKFNADAARMVLDLAPTNPVQYQVKLTGANKLQFTPPQKWSLRPVPDLPPEARLLAVGAEPGLIQHDEVLPLQISAADDVGLKKVELLIISKESRSDLKTLYQADTRTAPREYKNPFNYNVAELNAGTGDEVRFQLVATDVHDQTTRSEPLSYTIGATDKALEARLAARLRQIVSALVAQADFLQQTRSSWLSITRNFQDNDPGAQAPALSVLQSRLREFGLEMDAIGQRLVGESETNNLPDARFIYRLGTTIAAWGAQQREVLLSNCSGLEAATGTNVYERFNLGRELFSRALQDLERYRHVVAVLQGALETDVLATRCDSAQARYKRGLPVLRGENVVAPLGQAGPGLMASFYEDVNLNGKLLERKVVNPRFDNYAPGNRRENWSCRYEGEVQIAEDGDWTFGCVVDDGVRLFLDGNSLLPKDAWGLHAATLFKGEAKLKAGWHPMVIEFYQGSSESKLQLLAAKKGQELKEVPAEWLRPPMPQQQAPELATNSLLNAVVQGALKERVKNSLGEPAGVPPAIAPFTNEVQTETFGRLVREKLPVGETLRTNLLTFNSWSPEQSREPEAKADDLTGVAKTANRLIREELEKYRWRYEGAAALKEVQNAIEELREVTQELRREPYNARKTRTEQEQAKVNVAKAWQKELQRASAQAAHEFFETAKNKDATLAERATALNAATKTEEQLEPSVQKLASVLEQKDRSKDEVAGAIEQQVNEIANRYRELNDMQEKINREQVAAEARRALPPSRAFARAQAQDVSTAQEPYQRMKPAVEQVVKALRVTGDYAEAQKLEDRAGEDAQTAKGKETAQQVRELAMRTDRHFPSLAQSIPPPMRDQTQALDQHKSTQQESANALARPRLAMSLESARLAQQGEGKTAAAFGLLGEDLGALLEKPDQLASSTIQPLTDRAAALAGEKGEEARQAEIRAALERLKALASQDPNNAEALAGRLEADSALARQAAGERPKRQPLASELNDMSKLGKPSANWAEATDPADIAAGAAAEASSEIQAGPEKWESYNSASEALADAARQIRSDEAAADLASLNPFPAPPSAAEMSMQAAAAAPEANGNQEGLTGKAITEPPPKGLDQAEWARLADRLRQAIRSSGIENFSQEHQAAIRAYFERLSSDNQKPNP